MSRGVQGLAFLLAKKTQHPDSISNRFYYDIEFPQGHSYLHHWVAVRYNLRKGAKDSKYNSNMGFHHSDFIIALNDGVCNHGLTQFFGLGSETRKTSTYALVLMVSKLVIHWKFLLDMKRDGCLTFMQLTLEVQ